MFNSQSLRTTASGRTFPAFRKMQRLHPIMRIFSATVPSHFRYPYSDLLHVHINLLLKRKFTNHTFSMHHNPRQTEALCRLCRNCPTCPNFFFLCVSLKLIPSLLQFSPLRGIVLTTAPWQHPFPEKQIVPEQKFRVRRNEVFTSAFNPFRQPHPKVGERKLPDPFY